MLFLLLVMQCVCFTLAVVDDKSRKNSILEEMKKYVSCGVKKQSRTITAPGCEDKGNKLTIAWLNILKIQSVLYSIADMFC